MILDVVFEYETIATVYQIALIIAFLANLIHNQKSFRDKSNFNPDLAT